MATFQQTEYLFPHFPPPPSRTETPPPAPPHFVLTPPPSQPPPHDTISPPSQPPPHDTISPPSPPHNVPPPLPPPHNIVPPPSPHTIVPPPPSPHNIPPPPPLPPHYIVPPPSPHSVPPPPPPPGNHTTIIVVVFVSCGGVFFLAFVMAALWCFLKKKREKMVRKAKNVHMSEHRKVTESMIQGGPNGTDQTVMLSVEDDIHIEEDIYMSKSQLEHLRKVGLHSSNASVDSGHHHHV